MHGWELAAALFTCFFPIAIMGVFMGKSFMGLVMATNSTYEVSGGLAEQALNSIRTVFYLNGQKKEIKQYNEGLQGKGKEIIKWFYFYNIK